MFSFSAESFRSPQILFRDLQIVLAVICFFIPVIFRLFDSDKYYPPRMKDKSEITQRLEKTDLYIGPKEECGKDTIAFEVQRICKDELGFRRTLSDYENSSKSFLFGMMYAIAALLLIYNGVFHYLHHHKLVLNSKSHWYYILSGLSLIGVIIYPSFTKPHTHNWFSFAFFAGCFFCAGFLATPRESKRSKAFRVVAALTVLVLIVFLYSLKVLSFLYLEWIALIFIATHLIISALKSKRLPNY